MTELRFGEPPPKPASGRDDESELRPQLTARRERPPQITPTSLPQSQVTPSRATARHFAGRRGVSTVRASSPPEAHKRKVVVVARKVLTPNGGRRVLAQQVAYIRRGAADAGDQDGVFFNKAENQVEPRQFVERCHNDGVHYRLIVNPEDGTQLGDLKAYARRLMNGVEEDLGTDLDWIAGAHFDTGRPHLHMMIRGRRASGQSLKVSGAYLSSGLRDRSRDVATEILGPRAEHVKKRIIEADWLTPLDGTILQAARDGRIEVGWMPEPLRPATLRRLIHLENRGWTTPISPGVWRLPPSLRQTLLQVNQMHARESGAARILEHSLWRDQRSRLEAVSLQPGERLAGAYVGVHRTSHFPGGSHAVVLDLTDGRLAHFLMRNARSVMCLDRIREGAVIEVFGAPRGDRSADQAIAEVAAERDGVWSAADHAAARPGDWPKFIAFHEKRAQAMSVAGACVDLGGGRFAVPADYLSLARQADVAQWGEAEPRLRVLDDRTLDEQVSTPGLTWLDRLMTKDGRRDFSGPFGEAVHRALPERAKRLRITGLGSGEPLVLNEADIHRLTTFEIKSVFETVGRDGKAVFLIASGHSAAGVYAGRTHIAGAPMPCSRTRARSISFPGAPAWKRAGGGP